MPTNSTVQHIVRITNLCIMAQRHGVQLEIGTDFSDFYHLREQQKKRSSVYPMFDVTSSFIDETSGIWIAGRSEDGTLLHTQAVCMLDLNGVSLKEHFRRHKVKYMTPGLVEDVWSVKFDAPVALETVTGRVCYHGEFWLNREGKGYRGKGFSELFGRLIFELAKVHWSPDYMFCFVPSEITLKGVPARYGYFHSVPGFWTKEDGQVISKEHLVWMSSDDIEAFTALPLEATSALFEAWPDKRLSSNIISLTGNEMEKNATAVAAE